MVKYFVETAVELWSRSIIERYQAAETDRAVNAGKHWHSIHEHNIHAENQIAVLGFQFRWDFNIILLNSDGSLAYSLALERSNIRTKNLFGNVNIFDGNRTVPNYILSEDMLEVLNSRTSDNMIKSSGTFGIFKLTLCVSQFIFVDSRDHAADFVCMAFVRWHHSFCFGNNL